MRLSPLHPGEVLREEFLKPFGISAGALAKRAFVPRTRFERIAAEQTGITTDSALRLSRLLGTSIGFWLKLQEDYEIAIATKKIGKKLQKIKRVSGL